MIIFISGASVAFGIERSPVSWLGMGGRSLFCFPASGAVFLAHLTFRATLEIIAPFGVLFLCLGLLEGRPVIQHIVPVLYVGYYQNHADNAAQN